MTVTHKALRAMLAGWGISPLPGTVMRHFGAVKRLPGGFVAVMVDVQPSKRTGKKYYFTVTMNNGAWVQRGYGAPADLDDAIRISLVQFEVYDFFRKGEG